MAYHSIGKSYEILIAAIALLLLNAIQIYAADSCTVGTPLSGGSSHCSNNADGSLSGGYSWKVWSSGNGGCIITYNKGCAFKATWNNSGDFLARAGLQWNSTKTHEQIGKLSAEFAFIKSGTGGNFSYIGIYGWTQNPLIEYYIVEDYFSKPNPGTKVGIINLDGAYYDVYKASQVNKPAITGNNANFDQYFSIRKTPRQCGHISITKHFLKWDSLGLKLGKMYEAKVLAEAGGGSGSVDFTKASVDINKVEVGVLPVPETSQKQISAFTSHHTGGMLSVISLNGTRIKSMHLNGSETSLRITENLVPGVYFLEFRGKDKAPVSRSLYLKK